MKSFIRTIIAVAAVSGTSAFSSSAFLGAPAKRAISGPQRQTSSSAMTMRVVDIDSEAAFDKTIKGAGESLVVIDYSTTWCGPCKVIAPKFDELSDKYPDAVFIKVG
jgi:thioredoxin 1